MRVDVEVIFDLAEDTDPHGPGQELLRLMASHCIAIAYRNDVRPEVIARIVGENTAKTFEKDISDMDWSRVCARIATELEKRAHGG
jgi:hypothetical protein